MSLNDEYEQVSEHWKGIEEDRLVRALRQVHASATQHGDVGHHVRQFHNLLGYQAWGGLEQGGLCAGCLYRTQGFMDIPQGQRFGHQGPEPPLSQIHVEHTVPVASLVEQINQGIDQRGARAWNEQNPLRSWLYGFLMKHSIVTAATRVEGYVQNGGGMVRDGYAHRTGAFNANLPDRNKPFMRYVSETGEQRFVIYDLISQQPIRREGFSFDDHFKNLRCLLAAIGRADLMPPPSVD